jgi:hypothetical protein
MCHACLPPIGTKRTMAEAINAIAPSAYIVDYSALFGTTERKK